MTLESAPVKLFRHLVVLLLVAQFTGIPWVGLQGVSKAIQTYRNVRQQGLFLALKQVPKGKGNCGLCQTIRIAQGRQQQQQQMNGATSAWLPALIPALLPTVETVRPLVAGGSVWCVAGVKPPSRSETPPTPPPRLS